MEERAPIDIRQLNSPPARRLDALMLKPFAPLDWIVPGIIPEGTTLVVSPPKCGKSLLALDLAVACSIGGKAFGTIAVGPPRPVCYVDLESGERRLQARVTAQGWGAVGALEYHLEAATAWPAVWGFLRKHHGQRPLVFIDTLAAVMGDRPRDVTQFQHEYRTLASIQSVTRNDPGSAAVVLHHTRKASSADPLDRVSGTNGLSGAVDTPIVLDRPDRRKPEGTLHVMARDVEDGEYALSLRGVRWELAGNTPEDARRATVDRERDALRSRLGPVKSGLLLIVETVEEDQSAAEIFAKYGGTANATTLRRALAELASAGLVERVSHGLYRGAPRADS